MKTLQEQRTEAVLKMQERISELEKENAELNDEVRKLKLLVSSLVYEINQIWDINEMNDDLRMCAEKIDREVQLSKMAEDNRMVISALGFAIVPPNPKLDVKEI
jgi:predicted nuclease with TOPRIM domain